MMWVSNNQWKMNRRVIELSRQLNPIPPGPRFRLRALECLQRHDNLDLAPMLGLDPAELGGDHAAP